MPRSLAPHTTSMYRPPGSGSTGGPEASAHPCRKLCRAHRAWLSFLAQSHPTGRPGFIPRDTSENLSTGGARAGLKAAKEQLSFVPNTNNNSF